MAERLGARDVWKSYPSQETRLEVLRGLDLLVAEGEVLAVVGVSGVGKSTLLHVLGALDPADRGRIAIGGVPLGGRSAEQLAWVRNRQVGFVFQFHGLLPEFTALENTMMPLLIRRIARREAHARAERLLDRLGLGGRLSHRPAQLSGGEQQRVAIARGLVHKPAVVLADEPTGNLDPKTGEGVFELLRTISKESGMACVVATHNEVLARTCDRILQLCDGTLRDLTFPPPRPGGPEGPTPLPGASAARGTGGATGSSLPHV